MANDQLEIIIDREIWNRLTRISISSAAMRCLTVILGITHGIGKTSSQITLFQFVSATGIQKPHICRALNRLKDMGIIIVTKGGNRKAREYCINLDYSCWRPIPKKTNYDNSLSEMVKDIPKKDNEVVFKKEEISSNEVLPEADITEENEETKDMDKWW